MTTSIYDGIGLIIPLADVQHIEKHNPNGLMVITRHTRWDFEKDLWDNNIWIDKAEAEAFLTAWKAYREDLERKRI